MKLIKIFLSEKRGIALTEYLILLSLLTAGVIASVQQVGSAIGSAWEARGGAIFGIYSGAPLTVAASGPATDAGTDGNAGSGSSGSGAGTNDPDPVVEDDDDDDDDDDRRGNRCPPGQRRQGRC